MNKNAFDEMKNTQDSHWWFRGKRAILEKLLNSLCLSLNAQILEIGCGTGSNLTLLSKFGNITALEIDNEARKYAAELAGIPVLNGWLPDGLFNISGKKFDLICMFDVLEHIESDSESLKTLREYLVPDPANKGKLFITVPAYQWMYSQHDKELSHFRRYSKNELTDKLTVAGYKICSIGYMNTLLFPLMLLSRLMGKFCSHKDTGTKTPPAVINTLMFRIFSTEKNWAPKVKMPFGGTVYAICEVKTYE